MNSNHKEDTYKKDEISMQKPNLLLTETTAFRNAIKRGVYKQLYQKNMLTEQQLNELLAQSK